MSGYAKRIGSAVTFWAARDAYNYAKKRLAQRIAPMPKRSYSYRPRGRSLKRRRYAGSRRSSVYARRVRKFKQVGFPIRQGTTRKTEVINFDSFINSRLLVSRDLTAIQGDPLNTSIEERARGLINIRGFAIQGFITCETALDRIGVVNMAVIAERGCNSLWTTGSSNFVPDTNFFRAYDSTRQQDFSINLTGEEFCNLPINTDNYVVLARKRIRIVPKQGHYTGSGINHDDLPGSVRSFKLWLPCKRQVRYDTYTVNNDLATAGRTALCFWWDKPENAATTAAENSLVKMHFRAVTYWRSLNY